MFKKLFTSIAAALLLLSCGTNEIKLETDAFKLSINTKGVVSFMGDADGNNYLEASQASPLIAIRIANTYYQPNAVTDDKAGKMTFAFDKGTEVDVAYSQQKTYLTLEVKEVRSKEDVELVVWGPYANKIGKIVGECVGVVRDDNYAIGIRALNAKTIGGYPSTEDDVDPAFDIFATTSLVDVPDSLKVLYRGQTAKHTDYGSVVQAYCRNRNKDRIISMWGHDQFVAPAYNDGGVVGSKIALFGCPTGKALDYIETIVDGEKLAKPMIKGQWGKRTPNAAAAYIIYPFNEKNIDEAIAFTKRTGLEYLYHGHPFETWGHFELIKEQFPSGWDGLKACVDKAAQHGIKLGVHTLSNFTTTNDKYVTPVPDKRLARVGSSILAADINKQQKDIEVADPTYFKQMKNNSLHGVLIGNELVRYEKVSEAAPWKLINCQRGAWGTVAADHKKSDTASLLLDHPYNVFLTNTELTKEEARNIADLFNKTGVMQISFDGLEGAWSTGLGQYGLSLMIEEWYNHLAPEYKNCINDASMTTHYNWTMFTRMNWGEPWYAGFRESQMNYRLMNQDFYRRNLMPCMLGWFKYDANTSIEDVEWLLARSAAFDAGYTLVTNGDAVAKNGDSEQIIKAIREWEHARLSKAFPPELQKEMEVIKNEYHLEETSDKTWDLYPLSISRFKHENRVFQPGEPALAKWEYKNPYDRQPLQFIITADCDIADVELSIGGYSSIKIPVKMKKDESLKYIGEDHVMHIDKNRNILAKIPVDKSQLMVDKGDVKITFACKFGGEEKGTAKAEVKTCGAVVKLKSTVER